MKTISWLLYLTLSIFIMPLNWLRNRVKHGPSPRLWLASDHELLAEVKKRGLAKRQRATAQTKAVVVPPEIQIDPVAQDAIKLVAVFQEISMPKAREAVLKALSQGRGKKWQAQELSLVARTLAN